MNPDNNSLERTYFIGGPPRVGKSILAYALARKLGGHVVSTDAIRMAAKKACMDHESDLFIINRTENASDEEWLDLRLNRPHEVVENQNRESRAAWRSIVSFCNTFVEDSEIHIVEGVALLPELVARLEHKPKHITYIGNTNEDHLAGIKHYAEQYPHQDWMAAMNYGEKKMEGMARFIKTMSHYFKDEAQKYGFPYYEMDDNDFEGSIRAVIDRM